MFGKFWVKQRFLFLTHGGGLGAGCVAFLQFTHKTSTSTEGSATFFPADKLWLKAVQIILYTHINILPFVQGAYLLCTETIMNTENGSLLNTAC